MPVFIPKSSAIIVTELTKPSNVAAAYLPPLKLVLINTYGILSRIRRHVNRLRSITLSLHFLAVRRSMIRLLTIRIDRPLLTFHITRGPRTSSPTAAQPNTTPRYRSVTNNYSEEQD